MGQRSDCFLKTFRETISMRRQRPIRIDKSDLPEPAKRLLALACGSRSELTNVKAPPPLVARIGETFRRPVTKRAIMTMIHNDDPRTSHADVVALFDRTIEAQSRNALGLRRGIALTKAIGCNE